MLIVLDLGISAASAAVSLYSWFQARKAAIEAEFWAYKAEAWADLCKRR